MSTGVIFDADAQHVRVVFDDSACVYMGPLFSTRPIIHSFISPQNIYICVCVCVCVFVNGVIRFAAHSIKHSVIDVFVSLFY